MRNVLIIILILLLCGCVKSNNLAIEENNMDTVIEVSSKDELKIENIDGLYYIDGILIVNKSYNLPADYNPGDLTAETKIAADDMFNAAKKAGYTMWAQSRFRSYDTQKKLYNNYVKTKGKEAADKSSARPGYSEHQTGLAFDVCAKDRPCINSGFDNTKEAMWLSNNAYKFGFIIRYPKGKSDITGYKYESWHLRFVGVDLATKLYNDGDWITLEEFFGITSEYDK